MGKTTWHRPMLVCAGAMGVMVVVSVIGLVVDDRVLLGAPIWLKPLKFAVSIALYCVTWAWLVSLLRSGRRLAQTISTAIVAILGIEYTIIVTQVVRGAASHFNVSTALDATLFAVMGTSIAALWVGTLVLTVLLLRGPVADAASRWAIKLGALISLVGSGLGALMTSPTAEQVRSMREGVPGGVVGAHSVGVPDGGPGLPIIGWSTTSGDLRIPHFVGMHAIQALPLLVIVLGVLATRVQRLRNGLVCARLVLVAAGGYAGLLSILTWQALRGQPLTSPDTRTLTALAALVAMVAVGILLVLRRTPTDHRVCSDSGNGVVTNPRQRSFTRATTRPRLSR